jgi:hypothetical protein
MTKSKSLSVMLGAIILIGLASVATATPIASIPSVGLSATAVHTEGMERREARRVERRVHRHERRSERYVHRHERRAIRHGYY